MKTLLSIITAAALATSLYAGSAHGKAAQSGKNFSHTSTIAAQMPTYPLSYEQQAAIEFMLEEEKMARDVYITMYATYGVSIFNNIANSEQKHMDAIASLVEKYSLGTSVSDEVGVFTDQKIQALYDELTATGLRSLDDALQVGVTIENVDIADLDEAIAQANDDAKIVFENLRNGSEHHLAAFNKMLGNETTTSNQNGNARKGGKAKGKRANR